MTDPRLEDLGTVIRRLPRGAGIIFRHYELAKHDRHTLFRKIRRQVGQQRILLLADDPDVAWRWGAHGAHSRSTKPSRGHRTVAVHNARESGLARRVGADLIFVSPVFATRSHLSARSVGPLGLGLIAGRDRARTIALGGMTARRARLLSAMKIYGWAAIDAFRI